MNKLAQTSQLADLSHLSNLKAAAAQKDPAAIEATARRFEGLFAEMLVSSMRQTSFGDSLMGDQNSTYREFYDRELATRLTSGKGLGIGQLIRQQLGGTQIPTSSGVPGVLPKTAEGLRAQWAAPLPKAPNVLSASAEDQALLDAIAPMNKPMTDQGELPLALLGKLPEVTPQGSVQAANQNRSSIKPGTPDEFVQRVWPHAQAAARELGVDPRALVAQAALETGWGKSIMPGHNGQPSHNLFGIKATGSWSGAQTNQATNEFRNGSMVREQAAFRSYDSVADSFSDYVKLLKNNPRYQNALKAASDIHGFAQGLQRAGYATDPSYAHKLKSIAQGSVLRQALERVGNATTWEV
jgi:flagellar protein FlgJ